MNPIDREPLSPEERALADRLAREGGHASPSAVLDAAILGAARDALASPAPARVSKAGASAPSIAIGSPPESRTMNAAVGAVRRAASTASSGAPPRVSTARPAASPAWAASNRKRVWTARRSAA